MISVGTLVALGLHPTQARAFVEPLNVACGRFWIDTPARLSGFVAQCRAESHGFTRLEESLRWRDPHRLHETHPNRIADPGQAASLIAAGPAALASHLYAGEDGNRPGTDDGWTYRARGLISIAGRSAYRDAEVALGLPYLAEPDLVGRPAGACLVAAWLWHCIKGNALADSAQWDAITRAVHGDRPEDCMSVRYQWSEEGIRALVEANA